MNDNRVHAHGDLVADSLVMRLCLALDEQREDLFGAALMEFAHCPGCTSRVVGAFAEALTGLLEGDWRGRMVDQLAKALDAIDAAATA